MWSVHHIARISMEQISVEEGRVNISSYCPLWEGVGANLKEKLLAFKKGNSTKADTFHNVGNSNWTKQCSTCHIEIRMQIHTGSCSCADLYFSSRHDNSVYVHMWWEQNFQKGYEWLFLLELWESFKYTVSVIIWITMIPLFVDTIMSCSSWSKCILWKHIHSRKSKFVKNTCLYNYFFSPAWGWHPIAWFLV